MLIHGLVLLFAAVAPARPIEERHSLLLHASVGDKFSYEMRSVTKMGPQEAVFTSEYEMAIVSLEPKGTATFQTKQQHGKFIVGGKETVVPESVVTAVMLVNGAFLSVDPPSKTPEQARVSRIMQFVVAEKPVAVGEKWTWTDPSSKLNGNVGANGAGECVEFSVHNGIPCARLHISAMEVEGATPATSSLDVWLSLKDGMIVESRMTLENVPLAPGTAARMEVNVKRRV